MKNFMIHFFAGMTVSTGFLLSLALSRVPNPTVGQILVERVSFTVAVLVAAALVVEQVRLLCRR